MSKKFAIVCGPGRSGTSLAMSLVEACGYNLGKVNDFQHESYGGLRHGYGEHPLTNTQGFEIENAIDKLEEEGANAVKLIHLHYQWIPRLQRRNYDVRIVVTSRNIKEIWNSGMDIYPGWRDGAIQKICGEAEEIMRACQRYLYDASYNAYHLPFQKVISKDRDLLLGLIDFLQEPHHDENGEAIYRENQYAILKKMEEIIKPEIVQHANPAE